MTPLSRDDLRLLHRYVDGEATVEERASCERRLSQEPGLRAGLEELSGLRQMFAAGRSGPTVQVPAGFASGVLTAVRRQALVRHGSGSERASATTTLCRKLLLVAAAVVVGAVLLHTWLLTSGNTNDLHAAPGEVEQGMQRLDRLIESSQPTLPAAERRR